jgi:uncharacterized protein GlcG (DUF336 family)
MPLHHDEAGVITQAAIDAADKRGEKFVIAVVDAGANLISLTRMDGAWLGSLELAQKKARTSRAFDMPTEDLQEMSQPGGPLYGIEGGTDGFVTIGGGLPLKLSDGEVVGAIGVSGSTPDADIEVAKAGVAAFEK